MVLVVVLMVLMVVVVVAASCSLLFLGTRGAAFCLENPTTGARVHQPYHHHTYEAPHIRSTTHTKHHTYYPTQGAVSAVRLVRMTPEEMAPRQLQEERRKLEEKSLKMSVLPEGTSFINYVTRREELVQRETGRTRTPPPRGVWFVSVCLFVFVCVG